MASLGLIANYGSDEEDSSYTDSDDNASNSVTIKSDKEEKAKPNFFDAGESSSEESSKEEETDRKEKLPNPMLGGLPRPVFEEGNDKELLSVFTNPYEQAEQAKNTVLEKHVKMVERNIPKGKAGQVCFKYKNATIVYKLILFGVMFAAITAFDADAIAQAACSASTSDGIVSAIRRTCGSGQDSCNTICSNAISSMRAIYGIQGSATATCFAAFHFYYKHTTLKPEEKGKALMAMKRYGDWGCRNTGCGPNFCCCKA